METPRFERASRSLLRHAGRRRRRSSCRRCSLLLVVLSLWSWWQIFLKMFQLKRALARHRRVRGRVLEGRRPERALPEREPVAHRQRPRAHLHRRASANTRSTASRAATPAVTLDSARRAMRAAYQREIDALEAHLVGPRDRRLGVALHRPLRHRVGDHERVPRPRQREPGDARAGGARHRRGADRDRDRPLRGDSRGRRVQPLHARRRPARGALRDASSRNSRTSCSGRAERDGTRATRHAPRTRKPINQINVVPYIDVMLVLLVIFMVTAPLINPGEIELPSVGSKLTAPAQPLEVTLRTDGTLLAARPAGRRRAGRACRATSSSRASARSRRQLPDQPVVIAADKQRALRGRARRARPPAAQRRAARSGCSRGRRRADADARRDRPRRPARDRGQVAGAAARDRRARRRSSRVLVFSIRWQNRQPEPVTAELYAPPTKAPVAERRADAAARRRSRSRRPSRVPKPEPAPPPPPKAVPKPEPEVEKPDPRAADIARKAKQEEERKAKDAAETRDARSARSRRPRSARPRRRSRTSRSASPRRASGRQREAAGAEGAGRAREGRARRAAEGRRRAKPPRDRAPRRTTSAASRRRSRATSILPPDMRRQSGGDLRGRAAADRRDHRRDAAQVERRARLRRRGAARDP